jgi:hypothetical protein
LYILYSHQRTGTEEKEAVMAERQLKVGVWEGGGPPPGYNFTVLVPDVAFDEAMGFLTPDQYCHAAELVKDLAQHEDPTHSVTQRVESLGDQIHELKDKGGILGKINLRIFFYVDRQRERPALLILGAINKRNEDQTPKSVRIRMKRRLRKYLNGEWQWPQ